ncbi:MAG: hypothetical protein ACYCYO_13490 [Bacilli bacterium]
MHNSPYGKGIQPILELLHDCTRELAVTSDVDLSERVMQLFRSEDLEGIALLMQQQKLEREFARELQQLLSKWTHRLAVDAPSDVVI